ncbi:NTP transferase domain-containing protein [Lutibaculum baratangense]|uniref:Putative MobA-related protein n=1 Tax=Lutibaculum baratangense AMV1 TaxID=631454 RepID=V4R8I1_9HYPH|nr:molybdopterin-binding/glycosyltransferase family 2 protein [Lutibaculum baratangense]ESR22476.1 putative MobA-related protein [Lutibaculum baratangense AMV1]
MKFGAILVDRAEGAILAHTARLGKGSSIKKGTRLDAEAVARLQAAGVEEVVAASLGPDDVHEDTAANRLAAALVRPGLRAEKAFTGRANLFAEVAGLLVVDRDAVEGFNSVDEAITLATLPSHAPVEPGTMLATVKIIPFAAEQRHVTQAEKIAGDGSPVRLHPFRPRSVGVVATVLPGTTDKMLDKTARILAERLSRSGSRIIREVRVAHEEDAIANALLALRGQGAELLIVFGASAIVDRADVIPAGVEAAGGAIKHFGMPVDPGNLLLLGELDGCPVLGAPGCARSPKENGFDWVLDRLMADFDVGAADLRQMGVGGLLQEIVSRPQPRAQEEAPQAGISALILAAGQSRRMGAVNKLLQPVAGKPIVRHVVEAALASSCREVVVVTGHQREEVEEVLAGLDVRFVWNPDYGEGLSTSLRAGIGALSDGSEGALVLLGDMPRVEPGLIDALVAAFAPEEGRQIVVPVHQGKRGNPVLWARRYFDDLRSLKGDVGARHLIGEAGAMVFEVEAPRDSVLIDVDTPDALAELHERLNRGI